MKRFLSILSLLFFFLSSYAQEQATEMADTLRSSGKIYVVVAVISLLFVGLLIYLFSIDRRLKKIEKEK